MKAQKVKSSVQRNRHSSTAFPTGSFQFYLHKIYRLRGLAEILRQVTPKSTHFEKHSGLWEISVKKTFFTTLPWLKAESSTIL